MHLFAVFVQRALSPWRILAKFNVVNQLWLHRVTAVVLADFLGIVVESRLRVANLRFQIPNSRFQIPSEVAVENW